MGQVIDPPVKTKADFQGRLIGFETNKAILRPDHIDWLTDLARKTNTTREFSCQIYGFASRLGDPEKNRTLSYNRANEVARFLEKHNPLYSTERIDSFEAKGEDASGGGASNDDDMWRAVEVHVFMKGGHQPGKPGAKPRPKPHPRNMNWSIASGPSLAHNPLLFWLPVSIQVASFRFRNDDNGQAGNYLALMGGAGLDALSIVLGALEGLKAMPSKLAKFAEVLGTNALTVLEHLAKRDFRGALKAILKAILAGGSVPLTFSPFSKCKVFTPTTLDTIDGSTIANASATATIQQFGALWVYGKTWYTDAAGKRMFGARNFLEAPGSWSTQLQIPNFAASFVGGPLLRLT
ncbi:hypothetical protein sos41_23460 [Alphaproteobacteria bacterium SO-S41]|nr:hypothetical protein sos41_23460 [Alphaproteobacteria bacterium SO-S41]